MYWLVETEEQLQSFLNLKVKEAFIEVIPYNYNTHPSQNEICALYIKPLYNSKGFIVPRTHTETFSLSIDAIIRAIEGVDVAYVRDKKEFIHYLEHPKVIDVTLSSKYTPTSTRAHKALYDKYPHKGDINLIVPIVKHYEFCEKIYQELESDIKEISNNLSLINPFYNNKASLIFNIIESYGLKVNKFIFEQHFHSVEGEFVFTRYDFKTLTTRPSNKFGGVNYAALNKENGCRKSFIPRNDILIEIDITACHPTLLAQLIDYDYGDSNIHEVLAQMYGVDYATGKGITFKQLYGGIFEQYKELDFFKKVQQYTDVLWDKFQNEGFIECPLSKHRFYRDKLEKMTPPKLLNYLLQSLESSTNLNIMEDILRLTFDKNTKLILYCYDSFLLDFDEKEENLLEEIKNIFIKYKFQIKVKSGYSYGFK